MSSEPTGRDWRWLQFLKNHEDKGLTDAELERLFELRDDALWDYLFANSQDWLEQTAADALEQYEAGLTEELSDDDFELDAETLGDGDG